MSSNNANTNQNSSLRYVGVGLLLALLVVAGLGQFYTFDGGQYQCLDRIGCDWPRTDEEPAIVALLTEDEAPDPFEAFDIGAQEPFSPGDPGCRDCVPIDPPPPSDSEDALSAAESNRAGAMDHPQLGVEHDEWCKQHHYKPASCQYDDFIPLPEPVPDIEG